MVDKATGLGMLLHRVDPLAGAYPDFVCMAETTLGVRFERIHLPLQFLGQPVIVGIEKGDPFTASKSDAGVAGGAHSAVFLNQEVGVRIVLLHPLGGAVGGSVVHHDQFPVGKALSQNRVQGPKKNLLAVESRYDDRHLGRRIRHPVTGRPTLSYSSCPSCLCLCRLPPCGPWHPLRHRRLD